jgi:hypothetical protein
VPVQLLGNDRSVRADAGEGHRDLLRHLGVRRRQRCEALRGAHEETIAGPGYRAAVRSRLQGGSFHDIAKQFKVSMRPSVRWPEPEPPLTHLANLSAAERNWET